MARKPGVEYPYPWAIYRVMNRRDRREVIVMDDADRERFVETLKTVGWIAERLKLGSAANVKTLLNHWQRGGRP